jgi:hypothetical protein
MKKKGDLADPLGGIDDFFDLKCVSPVPETDALPRIETHANNEDQIGVSEADYPRPDEDGAL